MDRVKQLIEGGFDVNERDVENVTLLHWAAINNRKEIVAYFLKKGSTRESKRKKIGQEN